MALSVVSTDAICREKRGQALGLKGAKGDGMRIKDSGL